jgi:dTMP kinase
LEEFTPGRGKGRLIVKRGKFITFEGMEGSGKSTQAGLLASRLKREGHDVLLTREPGGTAMGESVRRLLKGRKMNEGVCDEAEILLFAASRAQLVRQIIEPALKRGTVVVSDRFADSTAVYQGMARGLDWKTVQAVNRFAIGCASPDLTILLDVDVSTGLGRVNIRNRKQHTRHDRIESEGLKFHGKVRKGYLQLAREYPSRIRVVNGSQGMESVAEVVWSMVKDVI